MSCRHTSSSRKHSVVPSRETETKSISDSVQMQNISYANPTAHMQPAALEEWLHPHDLGWADDDGRTAFLGYVEAIPVERDIGDGRSGVACPASSEDIAGVSEECLKSAVSASCCAASRPRC